MNRTRFGRRALSCAAVIGLIASLFVAAPAGAATKACKKGFVRNKAKRCVRKTTKKATTVKRATNTTAAPRAKGTVVFGTIGTSINATNGNKTLEENRKIAAAWQDQVNAAGGINGYKVKVLTRDVRADAARTLASVKDLDSQGIIAMAGPQAIMAPADKYVWDKKIPVVGSSPNNGADVDENPMFFSTGSIFSQVYGQVAAARDVGAKFFRSLSCAEAAACSTANPILVAAGKREGMKADFQLASAVAVDYTANCLNARDAGVDFLQGNGIPLAALTRDCARQNYHPTYAQGGAADQRVIDSAKGESVAGNLPEFGIFYNGPEVQRFRQALATTDLTDPTAPATQESVKTWIGLEMAGAVLKHLNSPNPTRAEYLAALLTIKGETLGGQVAPVDYTMQGNPADGSPHSGYDCWTEHLVKDGKFFHMNQSGQIVTKLTFICGTGKVYKTVIPT